MAVATKKNDVKEECIVLPPLKIQRMKVNIVGDSGLICHSWSDKAKKMMLDKQMKKAKAGKDAKDPHRDYLDSLYPLHGGRTTGAKDEKYGFPAIAFKDAAVNACSHVDGVTKVLARGAFHVQGELIPIMNGKGAAKPVMREDMVRIAMGTADIRYRGEFKEWHCELELRYNESVLSPEQIYNLFNTAGFSIGVGEHRPQKNGSSGMFHVA